MESLALEADREWILQQTYLLESSHPLILVSSDRLQRAILQQGPTCGLVAGAMAAELLGVAGVSVSSLLQLACAEGFTAQGEMFSARCLAIVLSAALASGGCSARAMTGFSDAGRLLRVLMSGGLLLVPYDADKNHTPCLRGGRGAHWAMVSGALIGTTGSAGQPGLVSARAASQAGLTPTGPLLLLCRHGKSRRVAVWLHRQLAASNSQLTQARTARDHEKPYVLSDGGVEAGLCGQFVLVQRSDAAPTDADEWLLQAYAG